MSDRRPREHDPLFSPLYPILDAERETEESMVSNLAGLARAGCLLVQLRAKELSSGDFHRWAQKALGASRPGGIRLIVNDRVDVALLVGADGVHLGQDDVRPESARKLLGEKALIGLSTHDADQARRAQSAPVDYVAIGPIFETATKRSAHPALGIEGARRVRAIVSKPLVAIGGITLEHAPALLDAGVDALAVISALKVGASVEAVAREWLELAAGSGGRRKE